MGSWLLGLAKGDNAAGMRELAVMAENWFQ
jgi:hypothetical protein